MITKITAPPIPAEVLTFLDTPTKEQIPRNWLSTTLLTSAELIAIMSKSTIYFPSSFPYSAWWLGQVMQSPVQPDLFFFFFTEPLVALGAFSLFCRAVRMDSTKNAPGARMKMDTGV